MGQPEFDVQNGTPRKEQAEPDWQDRSVRTGLTAQGCQDRTEMRGPERKSHQGKQNRTDYSSMAGDQIDI
jgi:hypothetical protein